MGADLMSGMSLGLLLGLVVGLATSPVVGIVVGALVSLLAVFLGLESRADSNLTILSKVQINGVRISAFGLAAVAGVLLGQYVRINNPMAEAPERQLARWSKAFPGNPALAAQMMINERTGITPNALSFDSNAAAVAVTAAVGPAPNRPGLYSGASDKALCGVLAPKLFGHSVENILQRYSNEGGVFASVAKRIGELPQDQQLGALAGAHALLCEWEAEKPKK
jgi:hypothetical protein